MLQPQVPLERPAHWPSEVDPLKRTPILSGKEVPKWARLVRWAEFRAQMVELFKSGRTPQELAREFEPSAQTILNWVAQADRDAGVRHDGLTTAERQELARLRRKVRQLEMERDILSHAAAWFARETGAVPPKGTDS